jgi:hypothetical protein
MLDIYLLIAIGTLQILDGITTCQALEGGNGVEANPALKWIMDRVGVVGTLVVTKVLLMAAVIAAALVYPSIYLTWVLGIVVVGYCWVVGNNYSKR